MNKPKILMVFLNKNGSITDNLIGELVVNDSQIGSLNDKWIVTNPNSL